MISPKQEAFLTAPNLEILYGGAAGGGKTSAILIAALQYCDQPNYDALILRRTFAELEMPGATLALSKKWLTGTDAIWRDGRYWRFPNGATLNFGYLQHDDDRWQYQSANYNFIAFDEAAEFPNEMTYAFLFSRLRRGAGVTIPPRMRLGANPIGPGAVWLKRRFITFPFADNLKDEACLACGHYHWKESCKQPECMCSLNPNSQPRLYIPAKLSDNPFIDALSYRISLSQLDPFTREALEEGDWNAKPPGKMFRREWFPIVSDIPRMDGVRRVRFWDLAATQDDGKNNPSFTAGARLSYYRHKFIVEDMRRVRETPGTVKDLVTSVAKTDGYQTEIWIEQEPGSSGIAVVDDYIRALPAYTVRPFKASGDKATRAAPMASQAEAGNIAILQAEWNEAYLEEVEQFFDPRKKNDQVDASAGAYNILASDDVEFAGIMGAGDRTKPDWGREELETAVGERTKWDW